MFGRFLKSRPFGDQRDIKIKKGFGLSKEGLQSIKYIRRQEIVKIAVFWVNAPNKYIVN
jgi:hypothetical protein